VADTPDDVSRETPAVPAVAVDIFGERLHLAERYVALLASDGVVRGLIGPREAPRLWERHLVNCAVVSDGIPPEADVCDIGTGAGLPGLVLALRRPDLRVTLVEPLLRRTTFLTDVVQALGLAGQVTVVRGRADDLHGRAEFAVVTSRAVAPMPRLLDWCWPLVRPGGAMLAMKGARAEEELREAAGALRRHGAGPATIHRYGEGLVHPPTTVVRVEATDRSRIGLAAAPDRGGRQRATSRDRKGGPAGE
jgi:16S rRNA (guanine527-N7)-methyltransferase